MSTRCKPRHKQPTRHARSTHLHQTSGRVWLSPKSQAAVSDKTVPRSSGGLASRRLEPFPLLIPHTPPRPNSAICCAEVGKTKRSHLRAIESESDAATLAACHAVAVNERLSLVLSREIRMLMQMTVNATIGTIGHTNLRTRLPEKISSGGRKV